MAASDLNRILDRDSQLSLMKKSDRPAIVRLLIHVLLIIVAGMILGQANQWLLQFAMTVVLGVLITFLFAPLHETIHKTAFKSQWLNIAVGWICGVLIFLPPRYFQAFHMAHHRHTQLPGKDPELDTPKPKSHLQYLFIMSGALYWVEQARALVKMALGNADYHFVPESRRSRLINEARIFVIIYAVIVAFGTIYGFAPILKYWIFPLLVGQPFLRLYLVAEHTLCPTVPDMLINTRTTISNSWVRFLAWNMPYHVEHHAWPAIPFHHLPATHDKIRDQIEYLASGYISVNRNIWKSI